MQSLYEAIPNLQILFQLSQSSASPTKKCILTSFPSADFSSETQNILSEVICAVGEYYKFEVVRDPDSGFPLSCKYHSFPSRVQLQCHSLIHTFFSV